MRRLSFAALLAFVFSIPLEDSVQFGVGRVSKVFGLLAVMAWVLAVASTGRLRRAPAALLSASALVAWALLSYFWSAAPMDSLAKAATLVQMLAVVWLVWDQAGDQHDLVALMRAFLLGAFAASIITFLASGAGQAVEGTRFSSTNSGPNNTGALLAVAVAVACYLLRADRTARWRLVYGLFLPVAMLALLLTASRTAALSLGLGLLIIVLDPRYLNAKRVMALMAVGTVAVVLVAVYLPTRSADRLGTTSSEISTGTLNGRTTYWRLSFDLFSDHPVQGVGAGAFDDQNVLLGGEGKVAHNAFMSILAEMGIVGLALFLTTIALAVQGLRNERPDLRRAWLAIGATWFVGANALTWEVRKITWFVFALALVQARVTSVARREAAEVSLPAAPETGAARQTGAAQETPFAGRR